MANVNIPLTSSEGVEKIYLADHDNNTYKVKSSVVPKNKETEVGDIYEIDFKPQIKIKRWNNNANLSVRVKGLPEGEEVVMNKGNKITHTKGYMETRFFFVEEEDSECSRHEMDVVLYDRPPNNYVEFTISSKNLVFYKQPELTQDEIDNGAERPDNIVGSYAVYNKELIDSVWLETKAMHIYRPIIRDATGKEIWGEIDIVAEAEGQFGTMKVTIDKEWLKDAVYPVTVDPTFGYTTGGGSTQKCNEVVTGNVFTCPQDGFMYGMSAYLSKGSASRNAEAACYYANQDLFGYTTTTATVPSAAGWLDFTDGGGPAAPNFTLTAGNSYFLVVNMDNAVSLLHWDTVTGAEERTDPQTFGTWDDPGTFATDTTNRQYSIYASYIIGKTLDTAAMTLGASKSIRIKKKLKNAQMTITTQFPGKFIDATTAVAIGISVKKEKRNKRTKSSSVSLSAYSSIRGIITANVSLALSALKSRFTKKRNLIAVATLSTLGALTWYGRTGVTLPIVVGNKKKMKKLKKAEMSLGASVLAIVTKRRDHSAEMILGASMTVLVRKVLSSNIQLSSDQIIPQDKDLDTNIDLVVSKTILVKKGLNAIIYASTGAGRFISGVINASMGLSASIGIETGKEETFEVLITLTPSRSILVRKVNGTTISISSDESKRVEGEANVAISAVAGENARIGKELLSEISLITDIEKRQALIHEVTISLLSDVIKRISTINDAIIGLVPEAETGKTKEINASLTLSAEKSIFVRRMDGVTIGLSPSQGKTIDGEANVSVGLSTEENKGINKYLDSPLGLLSSENKKVSTNLHTTLSVLDDIIKRTAKAASADISLSGLVDVSAGKSEVLEAGISLTTQKSIFVRKTNVTIIQIEGQENKHIDGSALVSITPAANADKSVTKDFDAVSSLLSEISKRAGKESNAGIGVATSDQKDIGKYLDTEITLTPKFGVGSTREFSVELFLGASKSIFVKKANGVTISMAGSDTEHISGVAETSLGLLASISVSSGKEEIISTSLSLGASKSIFVRKANGVTISMEGSEGKDITGEANVGVGLTVSFSASSDKEEVIEVGLSLGASKSIFVKKHNGVTITMTGTDNKTITGEAGVSIGLTASVSVSSDKEETLEVNVVLGASKSIFVKKVNGVTIAMAGSGGKVITGEADAPITLSASIEISTEKGETAEVTIVLSADGTKRINKILGAELTVTGDHQIASEKEEVLETGITLTVEKSIFVKKVNGVTISMDGSEGKDITGEASVEITLSPSVDIISDKGELLETDITLSAGMTVLVIKNLGALIDISGGTNEDYVETLGAEITLGADIDIIANQKHNPVTWLSANIAILTRKILDSIILLTGRDHKEIEGETDSEFTVYGDAGKRVYKGFSVTINIAGTNKLANDVEVESPVTLGAEVEISVKKSTGAIIVLNSERNMRVYKSITTEIDLSGDSSGGGSDTFDVTITLGASIDIIINATPLNVAVGLEEDMSKRIGKIFTIRQHSQSTYHDCK